MANTNTFCTKCGTALPAGSKFCVACGQPVAAPSTCPSCGAEVPSGARFCTQCRAPLSDQEAPELAAGNCWVRGPGDFACRLEASDLDGLFKKGVTVEEGTRGILLQKGKMVGVLDPGYHTLDSVAKRLLTLNFNNPCSVVLVDIGSVELRLHAQELRTADNQLVEAVLTLLVALDDPMDFYTNVMRSQTRLASGDLAGLLTQQVLGVMQSAVVGCTVDELYGNRELVQRLENDLRATLEDRLGRFGLQFRRLEFVSFAGETYDEMRRLRGERKRKEGFLEIEEQRADFNRKYRELCTRDRMHKVQNQADYDDFLRQVEQEANLKGLLRREEREELWRQYAEKKEDHDLARQHTLATLELQRRRELLNLQWQDERDALAHQHGLDDAQRRHRLAAMDNDHKAKLDTLQRENQAALARDAAQFDQELDQDRRAAGAGIEILQKMHDLKDTEARRETERKLARQRGEQEIDEAKVQAAHQRELERLETLSTLSSEALIAASPGDQAKLLAELKQTEALKDLSDEQILARAAENSPEVARAFAEKFRSAGGQEAQQQMQQLYERMLQEQKESSKEQVASQQESARMLRELMETALKTQRDTAVAAAQQPSGQGPAVVYPPPGSGAATVLGGQPAAPASAAAVACPQCRAQSPAESQFCGNCGARFT